MIPAEAIAEQKYSSLTEEGQDHTGHRGGYRPLSGT